MATAQPARRASTVQFMGQTAIATGPQQKQQQWPPSSPEQKLPPSAAGAAAASVAVDSIKPAYARAPIDFEGGRPHNGYVGDGSFIPDRYRAAYEGARGAYSHVRSAMESKYRHSAVETETGRKREESVSSAAPSERSQWTSKVHMQDKAYCRVTRSYESCPITTTVPDGTQLDTDKWTRFYMGNFNTPISTDGTFAPVTLTAFEAMALSFRFDESKLTGVVGTTGPRVVRGGPTSTSYVTGPMTQANGWEGWNQDFFNMLNLFRYSKLDKMEMIIKKGNYMLRGIGVDSNPMENWTIQNASLGKLYCCPYSGEPGILNSYTAGDGALTTGANGALNVRYFESLPGVRIIDLDSQFGDQPYKEYHLPVQPIQPIVQFESSTSGQPITGTDQSVVYPHSPTVDSYSFVAGIQNHNAFGWVVFWHHPDFAGLATTTSRIPPWIEISFRATMTWWGLLAPDETAGAAITALTKLPGAEQAMLDWYVQAAQNQLKQQQDLANSMSDLKSAVQPAAARAQVQDDYVKVSK